jgi:hypothetical protein
LEEPACSDSSGRGRSDGGRAGGEVRPTRVRAEPWSGPGLFLRERPALAPWGLRFQPESGAPGAGTPVCRHRGACGSLGKPALLPRWRQNNWRPTKEADRVLCTGDLLTEGVLLQLGSEGGAYRDEVNKTTSSQSQLTWHEFRP